MIVEESDQIMAIMKSGKVIRSNVAEVKRTGRTTQGVTLAKPDKNDEIISIARNEETDEDDAEQAAAENGAVQNDAAAQSQAETTTENSAETGTEATSDAGDGENVEPETQAGNRLRKLVASARSRQDSARSNDEREQ